VKLGLGVYSAEWIPSEGITHHQVYANDLEQAKLAEQVGLDSIWYTEHHFLNWNPNVMGMCAAVAAVTSRIQLGPSVVLAPLHNPIKLAEECAMVDVLSNGRFTIGVGLGYRDVEYAGFNVRRPARARMTEELVQVSRKPRGACYLFHNSGRPGPEIQPMSIAPFSTPGRFWRGNLHMHSTLSDGALSPEPVGVIFRSFAKRGDDFVPRTGEFPGKPHAGEGTGAGQEDFYPTPFSSAAP